MVGQPEILPFLLDVDGRSGTVQGDIVQFVTTPAPLEFAPDALNEIVISVARNTKYWALDRSFTVPLKFVEDGARIIKEVGYKKGTEEILRILLMSRRIYYSLTEYGIYYDRLYIGELDLSQMKHSGPVVTCNIMEGGIPKYVKTNESVKYEFKMRDDNTVKVRHTGLKLKRSITLLHTGPLFETDSDGSQGNPSEIDGYLYGVQEIAQEGRVLGLQTASVFGEAEGSSVNYATDTRWFVRALQNITLNFHFILKFKRGRQGFGTSNIRIELVKGPPSAGTVIHTFLNETPPTSVQGVSLTIDQSVTVTLQTDEVLFIRVTLTSNSGVGNPPNRVFLQAEESQSTINYNYTQADSTVKYFTLKYVFEQLTDKLTDGKHTAVSDLLDNISATYPNIGNLLVTCGDALRGFPDPIFKTTLSDFYTSVNALLCVEMGSKEGKLRLEQKSANYSNPIVVGNAAPAPTYSPATDYHYTLFKVGYNPVTLEDVNGRYAFNNSQTYSTPYTRQQKELNLMSVYHADPYLIEHTRINFEGRTTTDSSNDNEIFFTCVMPTVNVDGFYELDRRLNAYATNHPETETIFNLPITPKQNLFRHEHFIHSCFYKQDHKYLKLETTDKWRDLIVSKPGERVIDEDADVQIGSFGAAMFLPWLIDIEVESPIELIDQFDRAVQYVDNGLILSGLRLKASIEPLTNNAQNCQLLSSPFNNIPDLVNVFE